MTKFKVGQLVVTAGIMHTCGDSSFSEFVTKSFQRHASGDWGDMEDFDKSVNDRAIKTNSTSRIFSAYEYPAHPDWKIWIITESNRLFTTILFPSEY